MAADRWRWYKMDRDGGGWSVMRRERGRLEKRETGRGSALIKKLKNRNQCEESRET